MPTYLTRRIYNKRVCSKVFRFTLDGQFEIGSLLTIPLAWVKANKRIRLTWFWRGDLGCSWWMWFELRLWD